MSEQPNEPPIRDGVRLALELGASAVERLVAGKGLGDGVLAGLVLEDGTTVEVDLRDRLPAALVERRIDHAMVALSTVDARTLGVRASFEAIARVACEAIDVASAGVWLFDETRERLRAEVLYDSASGEFRGDAHVVQSEYPRYFEALLSARVIAASVARTDPRTAEFAALLEGEGIQSLLDAPVRLSGRVVGAVCIEHKGPPRTWRREEAAFAASLADRVAAVLAAEERRLGEVALLERDVRFRSLLEQSSDAVFCFEHDPPLSTAAPVDEQIEAMLASRLAECNATYARAYGFPEREEALGRTLRELNRGNVDHLTRTLQGFIADGYRVVDALGEATSRSGVPAFFQHNAQGVIEEGCLLRVWGSFRDVSEGHRARAAMHLYEQIVATVPDMLSFVDSNYCYRAVNDAYLRAHKKERDEIVGHSVPDLMGADVFEQVVRPHFDLCLAGEVVRYQDWFEYAGAGRRFVDVAYMPTTLDPAGEAGVVVVVRDLTDQRRLEEQLLHSQKLDAIGRLAGGIAHDFNNLLTAILVRIDLAANVLSPEDFGEAGLEEVRTSSERAADLTRQLLTFARKQVIEPAVVQLNDEIHRVERLLGRLIGERVRLVVRAHPRAGAVRIDPGQLEQLIVNLAVNARDAMPRGGDLTIATAPVTVDDDSAERDLEPGDYVSLTVRDSGTGMTDEVVQHLFEPFFTTKPPGEGTGLGLATCHGIVARHGGSIWAESTLGGGTTFTVHLPRVADDIAPTRAPPQGSALAPGSETILLVEDEDIVRTVAAEALTNCGYTVHTAATGAAALALVAELRGPLDLLLTDVVLPGINGDEIAARLTEQIPGLLVLFSSGYPKGSQIVQDGVISGSVAYLEKPYRIGVLTRKVREILDSRTE